MQPFIETFLGYTFKPLDPDFEKVRIQDIAHALSNQGRFSGHTRFRYSVAEHSVRVSELIEELGHDRQDQLWGLLHDASEAYLVDLPTPLKSDPTIGDAYRAAEERLMQAIRQRFCLPAEPEIVRIADAALLTTEVRDLMHPGRDYWKKLTAKPLPGRIRPWGADVAEYEFLKRFYELGGT